MAEIIFSVNEKILSDLTEKVMRAFSAALADQQIFSNKELGGFAIDVRAKAITGIWDDDGRKFLSRACLTPSGW